MTTKRILMFVDGKPVHVGDCIVLDFDQRKVIVRRFNGRQ